VDEDQTDISLRLISRLEADPSVRVMMLDRQTALEELEDVLSAAVIIPAGFGEQLTAGENTEITVYQNSNEFSRAQLLVEAVSAASAELSGSFDAATIAANVASKVGILEDDSQSAFESYQTEAFLEAETAWESGSPIAVEMSAITRNRTPAQTNGAYQSSPGMLVMFALFFTFSGGSILLVERDQGTLRRLLVMPMGKGTLITGKLMGIYIGSLIQMSIMVLAGQFLFGVDWGQDPLALTVMLLAYGLAGTALGLMVAALAKTIAQASAAGTIVVMALASLGGAWWSIEIVPSWMKSVALALPTGWAMRGFQDIVTRGLSLDAIFLEAVVLIGFAALFLVIGIWQFDYE
jgi:ABC-2 type transport system permease protein